MKYLKKINIEEIDTNDTKKELKNSYEKGKIYYEEVEENQKQKGSSK